MSQLSQLFTKQATQYAKFRPQYPEQLFELLRKHSPNLEKAWDCATGSGQCASQLSNFFEQVYASDLNSEQLKNAPQKNNIHYFQAPAESSNLPSQSLSLITVAQAIHWFDLKLFFQEVQRVLIPGGLFAAWGYAGCKISQPVDEALDNYTHEVLKGYWTGNNKLVSEGYDEIQHPFRKLEVPQLQMQAQWNYEHLMGYLESWSGTQTYKDKQGKNPLLQASEALSSAWGDKKNPRLVTWDLTFIAGKKT